MSLTPRLKRSGHWLEAGLLLAILAVAAYLRFTQLDAVPPGMTHDEAAFGAEAERVLAGERPIYFALGYGHEPLYAYLVAVAFSLLGHTLTALRVTSAVCGLLVVLGTYLVARRMFGVPVALISAAWMAGAFWPLSLSRQALRAVTLPMLWLPGVWFFWGGLQATDSEFRVSGPRSSVGPEVYDLKVLHFALAGLFLGASFYTYMASRVAWVVYPLFGVYMLLFKRTRAALRRAWPGFMITLVVAALVALPLFLHLRTYPEAEKRFDAMLGPIRDLVGGNPERVARHAWNALRVFSWEGDRFWAYNIPGRPIFDWVGSALFYVGLLVALWHFRAPSYAFLLIWLVAGLAPALVTTNEGIFLRAIVAQPATYVLVGIGTLGLGGIVWGARSTLRVPSSGFLHRSLLVAGGMVVVGLVAAEAVRSYQAYFLDWPSRPEARNIYNYNLVASARYLSNVERTDPAEDAVGISALYPLYYHDPWIWRYVAWPSDSSTRWFDGRGCIVYPQGEAEYILPALAQLHPALQPEFVSQASLVERVELGSSDQNPYFDVWQWHGSEALDARLDELLAASPMWVSPEVQFTQPELRQRLEKAPRFGDVVALVGYRLNGNTSEPGEVLQLVTYWRALRAVREEDDWKTFAHLLDAESQVIGGVDVLNCPPTGWLPGDVAVQVHEFTVGENAPRNGEAYVEVGLYRDATGREPIRVDDAVVGDRVLLTPIRIR